MDITTLDVPEEDANRVRQMQMSTMEWDESGEADLRKGFRKGKRSKFRGERLFVLDIFMFLRAVLWILTQKFPRDIPVQEGVFPFPCKCCSRGPTQAEIDPSFSEVSAFVADIFMSSRQSSGF